MTQPSTAKQTLIGTLIGLGLAALAGLATLSGCDRAPTPAPSKPTPAAKPTGLPTTAQSFETAKKWLYEKVYSDHAKTFYCGCAYTKDVGQAGAVNLRSCGVTARQYRPAPSASKRNMSSPPPNLATFARAGASRRAFRRA